MTTSGNRTTNFRNVEQCLKNCTTYLSFNLTVEKSHTFTTLVAIFLVEPTVICLQAGPTNMWNEKHNNGLINAEWSLCLYLPSWHKSEIHMTNSYNASKKFKNENKIWDKKGQDNGHITQNSHVRKITPGVIARFSSYGPAQAPSKYSSNKARSVAEKLWSVFPGS
jgi:hypothetical protein